MNGLRYPQGRTFGRIVVLFHITSLPLALSRALESDVDNWRSPFAYTSGSRL